MHFDLRKRRGGDIGGLRLEEGLDFETYLRSGIAGKTGKGV